MRSYSSPGVVSEIHQDAKLKTGCVQIIQELPAMLIGQSRDSFQFHDNFLEANVVRFVSLLQYSTTIAENERWSSNRRNPLVFKFDRQALLIDGFKKAAALLVVYLEAGANNGIAFFLVNDFRHFICVNSRDSRVKSISPVSFWLFAVPTREQIRPFLPETRPRSQIDPALLTDSSKRLLWSRTECCLIYDERTAAD